VFLLKNRGAQDNNHCNELHARLWENAGSRQDGREQSDRMTFGRSTALLSTDMSDETRRVMAGGYNRGAGSNDNGTDSGILLDGDRCQ
jgi:hypothetical protein